MLHSLRLSFSVLALLCFSFLVACQAKSPEEQVAEKRARYTVKLNSWFANVENQAPEEPADGAETAEGEEADAEGADQGADTADEAIDTEGDDAEGDTEGEGEDMAMTEPLGPQPHTVVFDVLVIYDGRGEPLPGITVLVSHAGAGGEEKGSWLEYLETPNLLAGTSKQVGFQKQGVLFEEGDQFAVTLEKNVPPAERDQYREFASVDS